MCTPQLQDSVFSEPIESDATFTPTLQKPPDILHQVSNLQFQRCVPAKKSIDEPRLFTCSADISFASESNDFYPPLGFSSHCRENSGRALPPANATGELHLPVPAEDGDSCIVCMERQSLAVLLECGHSGLCVDCAGVLWAQASRRPAISQIALFREPMLLWDARA